MKRIIISSALSLLFIGQLCAAEKETPDTVFTATNVSNLILTESSSGVTLTLQGKADDEEYFDEYTAEYSPESVIKSSQSFIKPYSLSHNGKSYWDLRIAGIHFGFVDALGAPSAMDQQMGRSFEIGIDECLSLVWRDKTHSNSLGVGIGVNWRNYRMTGDTRYLLDNGNITLGEYPEGTTPQFSNLKVFSVSFPIFYEHSFNNLRVFGQQGARFRLAMNLNWNSHASLTTRYLLPDGYKAKEGTKHIGQRPFSVDFQLSVAPVSWGGVYVRYSPMSVLSKDRGPSFTTLTTGINLFF